MFGKRRPLRELNHEKDKISQLPADIVKKISDALACPDAYRFATASWHLFFTLDPAKVLTKRPDHARFIVEKLENMIRCAVNGMNKYIQLDAVQPKYVETQTGGVPHWTDPDICDSSVTTSIIYDKGYCRATRFNNMISDENNTISVRAFALYVLLRESNGKKLKLRVNDELIPKFGRFFLKMIESYVQNQFPSDQIKRLEAALLKAIHDDQHKPLPQGLTNQDFIRGLEVYEEKKASCVLS